jgi:hypothetical protein
MSAVAERRILRLEDFGELTPISRAGGQGRVYRPALVPPAFGSGPIVVKRYRRAPAPDAAVVLQEMVAWSGSLEPFWRSSLHRVAAWPLAVIRSGGLAAGIVMPDLSGRFEVPFVMPSGRRDRVLLTLEHLLGADGYLQLRGLAVRLDTFTRAEVAERICDGLAFLHRHAIVASDIAPNNLLVAFSGADGSGAQACFIDCDSMVFHGRQALAPVQTGDWNIPVEYCESPSTRAADAYKLGLVILRLFTRSHDARSPAGSAEHVPLELHGLLARALSPDAVNRPPAGEWQRALRGLLAEGRLNQRYPGPAPAVVRPPAPSPMPAPRSAAGSGLVPARGSAGVPGAAPPAPGVVRRLTTSGVARPAPVNPLPAALNSLRAAVSSNPQRNGVWLRRTVAVAWVVAGTAVLLLVLSRLFADAVPSPGGGNLSGGGNGASVYQYAYPRSQTGQLGGGQGYQVYPAYPVYPGQGVGQVP